MLNILKKTLKLIAQIFLKLATPKDAVTETHKRSCFWKPFDSQRVNKSQKLLKSAEKNFSHKFWSLRAEWNLKKAFLVRHKILRLLANTLTGDYQHSHNMDNLTLPVQMILSQKPNTFCCFFIAFMESTLNGKYFEKKLNLIAYKS